MKGALVEKAGGTVQVVDSLEKPTPADGQVLVKSVFTAINPVDAFMASSGILVLDWPLVLGCDAAGVIVEVGPNANGPLGPLKAGDEVCGCTRLGSKGYSTCQEYFLMDAAVLIPKPKNISLEEAATVGVGSETAALGIFNGLKIPLPDTHSAPAPTDEWVLVLGGAGSVGKFAVQMLAAVGYKVLTTCSTKSVDMLKGLGVTETVDYKSSESDQLEKVVKVTGGKVNRIFDTTSSSHKFAAAVFSKIEGEQKLFSTTNDWEPMTPDTTGGAQVYQVQLGPIGRPEATALNKDIGKLAKLVHKLVEEGKLKTSEYEVIGHGIEEVDKAWQYQLSGKAGSKKVLVRIGAKP